MFTCDMIQTDVGLFLKGLEQKVAPFCLVVTLWLARKPHSFEPAAEQLDA